MATEIWQKKDDTWRFVSQPTYNDGGTLRTLSEVHYNDASTWRQCFGSTVAAETLAWDASAPTGIYDVSSNESTFALFTADITGGFCFSYGGGTSGGSGTPIFGTYRPGVTGGDAENYEISINTGSVLGNGTKSAVGDGTLLDGTYQALDTGRGVSFISPEDSNGGSISVTVIIREIATPANITATATFNLAADSDG